MSASLITTRLDADTRKIERKGIQTARGLSNLLKSRALIAFKRGEAFDSRDVIRRSLAPLIKDAMLAAHITGERRAELLYAQALREDRSIKAGVFDFVLKFLQRKSKAAVDRLNSLYETQAFSVVSDVSSRINDKLRVVVDELISKGAHVSEGVATLSQAFDELGLTPKNGYQLENVFRTQTQLAYGAGRWEMDQEPEIQDILWGYKYSTVGDDRVRPTHEALEGVTLPKDDPFWQTFWPPNGWSCRCVAIPIFEERAIKKPPTRTEEGDVVKPDKGFEFNAGKLFKSGEPGIKPVEAAFNPDQPRDERGRFGEGGGGGNKVPDKYAGNPKWASHGDVDVRLASQREIERVEEIKDADREWNGLSKTPEKEMDVDVKDLVATQRTMQDHVVAEYRERIARGEDVQIGKDRGRLSGTKIGNTVYVEDGHHRVKAAVEEGKTSIRMSVRELQGPLNLAFNEDQPRGPDGKFISTGLSKKDVGKTVTWKSPLTGDMKTGTISSVSDDFVKVQLKGGKTTKWPTDGLQVQAMIAALHESDGAVNDFPSSAKDFEFVENLGGSTGAELHTDPSTGKQYVVKYGGGKDKAGHLAAEFAADRVYEAAGIDVPKGKMIDGAKVTEFLEDGRPLSELKGIERQSAENAIRENFAADALLANWDVVGLGEDNVLVTDDYKTYRVDNGGSFDYRAQGLKKEYTSDVPELTTMRDPKNGPGAKIFSKLSDAEVAVQINDLYDKRDDILDAVPKQYHTTVSDRLDNMKAWADEALGEKSKSAKTQKAAAAKPDTAPEGITGGKSFLGSHADRGAAFQAAVGKTKFTKSQLEKVAAINDGTDNDVVYVPMAFNKSQVAAVEKAFPGKTVKTINALKYVKQKQATPGAKLSPKEKKVGKSAKPVAKGDDFTGGKFPGKGHIEKGSYGSVKWRNAQKKWASGLKGSEHLAVDSWKGSSSSIRASEKGSPPGKLTDKAKAFNDALDKAPKYEGIVYRGMKLNPVDIKKYTDVGSVVHNITSQSSSRSAKKATDFAGYGSGQFVVAIRSKTGASVWEVPGTNFKSEYEVVMRKDTKYRVVAHHKNVNVGGKKIENVAVWEEI